MFILFHLPHFSFQYPSCLSFVSVSLSFSLAHSVIRLVDIQGQLLKHPCLFPRGVPEVPKSLQGVLITGGIQDTASSTEIRCNILEFYMYSFLKLICLGICLWSRDKLNLLFHLLYPNHHTFTFEIRGMALSRSKSYYIISK